MRGWGVTRFEVWAPAARRVELAAHGRHRRMQAVGGGRWALELPSAGPGTDYAFALDGGQPLPDPRSAWQPNGVHGASRVLDHGAFGWTDADWQGRELSGSLFYELHVGTFTPEGTFDAAADRLDHLLGLGVTTVQLLPVPAFDGRRGWGYDGVSLFAVHEPYGGPDGLKRFVDTCHASGLAVFGDVVYNHLGPSGNYLGRFGPYFTDAHQTPWGPAVNYDQPGSREVRRFVVDNALAWLRDYHLDGLRLDATHQIVDHSPVHVLAELGQRVEALSADLGRPLSVVAETGRYAPRLLAPRSEGGYGLDGVWHEDPHHAIHAALTGERDGYYADYGSLRDLAATMRGQYVVGDGDPGELPRERVSGVGGHRLVTFLQNHDQVGNRMAGERIGHLVSPGRARIAAALLLLGPFTPLLFQGEEWGASTPWQYFTDFDEPDLAEAVRAGRWAEFADFGWDPDQVPDPQSIETFRRSVLDWGEVAEAEHAEVLEWYRRLVQLRRDRAELRDGALDRVEAVRDEEAGWLNMRRGRVQVAVNLGERQQPVPLAGEAERVLLAWGESRLDRSSVELGPDSVAVVELSG